MKIRSMTSNLLLLLAVAISLVACGGGGSGGSENILEPDIQDVELEGSPVKGPIANATVTAYVIDWTKADLKGAVIDEGTTDAQAQLQGLVISAKRNPTQVLIEFTGGTDLTTGEAPLVSPLRTIYTLEDLFDPITLELLPGEEAPVFATPLSTFLVDYLAAQGDDLDTDGDGVVFGDNITNAIRDSQKDIKDLFGFGVISSTDTIDLFRTSPVFSDTDSQADSLAYRTASEAFAAILVDLVDNGADSSAELTKILADDLYSDGIVDGNGAGGAIDELSGVSVTSVVTQSPSSLVIPGTAIPVTSVATVMQGELSDIGSDVIPTSGVTSTVMTLQPLVGGVDTDGDLVPDAIDDCPAVAGSDDFDNDGFCEFDDLFPQNGSRWADADGDCGVEGVDFLESDPNAGEFCGEGVEGEGDQCPDEPFGVDDIDGDGLCGLAAGNPAYLAVTFNDYLGVDFKDIDSAEGRAVTSPCDQVKNMIDSSGSISDDANLTFGAGDSAPAVAFPDNDAEDEFGETCRGDTDVDGEPNLTDVFPFNASEQFDFDGDCGVGPFNQANDGNGCGDNSDPDIDGDGVANAFDTDNFNATLGSDCDGDGVTNLELNGDNVLDKCKLESLNAGYLGITLYQSGPPPVNCGLQGFYPYAADLPPFVGYSLVTGATSCAQVADVIGRIEGDQILMEGDFQGDINGTLIGDISIKALALNPGDLSGPPQVNFAYSATWEIDVANETLTATNITCIDDPDGVSPTIAEVCGADTARNLVAGGIGGVGGVPLSIVVEERPADNAIYLGYQPSIQAAAGVTIDPEAATSSSYVSIKIAY